MNRTPVADWQQLSALYELADALDPDSLKDWLTQLREQSHPLLAQLEQMLVARQKIRGNDFLGTLPRLSKAPEPRLTEWRAGVRIGPYRLLRKIGSGGMAEVWLAHRDDGAFQRQVAIKLLFRHAGSDQRDSFAQRFDRERDILASLDHPHIAGLHDAGVTPNGQPWLALEYVEGQTLTTWCDARYLTIEARVHLFRQVLLAVQHAHANLVIHRDLKPANILVTSQGEVRLLDFGIAKLMEPEGGALLETELTRIAGRPMTPQYASPEQLMGQPLTTACDVYSLGVVLYELLCGERPYELKVESTAQLEQAILDTEPRAPSRRALNEPTATARGTTSPLLRKLLASDLDAIVLRALAKQPAQRYGSVEALGADLDRWSGGEPVEARTPSTVYRVGKFVRRHALGVSLGSGAIASLVAVAAAAVAMGLQAREDSTRAVASRDFMLNIFQRANQEKSRGADITARDLLETGRKDVLTRLAGQPKLQAELLQGIARIQGDMGEYAKADATFAELIRLQSLLRQPAQEAWSRADQAYNAYQMNDALLAATFLKGAREVPGRPLNDAALNARFDELDGWLAISRGDAAGAVELLRSARQRSVKALGADHLRSFRLGQVLLRAEGKLRNFDAGLALHAELRQTARKVNGIDGNELAGLDWDHVRLLQDAGRLTAARALVEVVLPQCVESLGADAQPCRVLLISRDAVLLRLGYIEAASADLPRLARLADDKNWPYVRVEAMLMRFRLASRMNSGADLRAIAEEVREFGQSGPEVAMSPVFKAAALLALAESSLLLADPKAAQLWVDRARTRLEEGGGLATNLRFSALADALSGVALLHQGEGDRALPLLRQADARFAATLGADHPVRHLMALNVALALDASGKPGEALAIVRSAQPVLSRAFGATSPTCSRATALLGRLQTRASGANDALGGRDAATGRTPGSPAGSFDFFS